MNAARKLDLAWEENKIDICNNEISILNLTECEFQKKYIIVNIDTDDEELDSFLFTLGCYAGEEITVVSTISGNYVISVRDGRYNIDKELAKAITVA